jgi:hypothetical protein
MRAHGTRVIRPDGRPSSQPALLGTRGRRGDKHLSGLGFWVFLGLERAAFTLGDADLGTRDVGIAVPVVCAGRVGCRGHAALLVESLSHPHRCTQMALTHSGKPGQRFS